MFVACVLRESKDYDAEYVERLRDGVQANLSASFVCVSNVPVPCERIKSEFNWPGWWSKMELFRPDIEGDMLYFDLDTVIVGDLKKIASVNNLTMLSDFFVPDRVASGMMFIPEAERAPIWREWVKDPEGHIKKWGGFGDQGFLGQFWGHAARWQDELPGKVLSYKAHILKGAPIDNASVVCFHGQPRPRAVNWKV